MKIKIPGNIPSSANFDLVVFAVQHGEFAKLNIEKWVDGNNIKVLDANNVLSINQTENFTKLGCTVSVIGKGEMT